jgi:hypothetical protein
MEFHLPREDFGYLERKVYRVQHNQTVLTVIELLCEKLGVVDGSNKVQSDWN